MILNVENFKKFQNAIISTYSKIETGKLGCFYFDFSKKLAFFQRTGAIGKIKFDFTSEPNEDYVNVYVDVQKFLYLVKDVEKEIELKFDKAEDSFKPVFKQGKNSYVIQYIIDEDDVVIDDYKNYKEYSFNVEVLNRIKEAVMFIDVVDTTSSFNSVVLNNSSIMGASKLRMYEYDFKTFNFESSILLHKELAKIMLTFNQDINLKISEDKTIISCDDIIEIHFSNYVNNGIFFNKEEQKQFYSDKYYFTANRKELLEAVKFILPFFIEDSRPVRFSIENASELKISTITIKDNITKIIPISYCSPEIIGYSAEYHSDSIKNALTLLDKEEVRIDVNSDFIGINIRNLENNDIHMICASYIE